MAVLNARASQVGDCATLIATMFVRHNFDGTIYVYSDLGLHKLIFFSPREKMTLLQIDCSDLAFKKTDMHVHT